MILSFATVTPMFVVVHRGETLRPSDLCDSAAAAHQLAESYFALEGTLPRVEAVNVLIERRAPPRRLEPMP